MGSTNNTPEPDQPDDSDDDYEHTVNNNKAKPQANSKVKTAAYQRELALRIADNRRRLLKVMEKTRAEAEAMEKHKSSKRLNDLNT